MRTIDSCIILPSDCLLAAIKAQTCISASFSSAELSWLNLSVVSKLCWALRPDVHVAGRCTIQRLLRGSRSNNLLRTDAVLCLGGFHGWISCWKPLADGCLTSDPPPHLAHLAEGRASSLEPKSAVLCCWLTPANPPTELLSK